MGSVLEAEPPPRLLLPREETIVRSHAQPRRLGTRRNRSMSCSSGRRHRKPPRRRRTPCARPPDHRKIRGRVAGSSHRSSLQRWRGRRPRSPDRRDRGARRAAASSPVSRAAPVSTSDASSTRCRRHVARKRSWRSIPPATPNPSNKTTSGESGGARRPASPRRRLPASARTTEKRTRGRLVRIEILGEANAGLDRVPARPPRATHHAAQKAFAPWVSAGGSPGSRARPPTTKGRRSTAAAAQSHTGMACRGLTRRTERAANGQVHGKMSFET